MIVLINTEAGAEEEVFNELKNEPEVTALYMVYGLYDIVAIIEGESLTELRNTIYHKIRRHHKIRSTLSMLAVNEFEKKRK